MSTIREPRLPYEHRPQIQQAHHDAGGGGGGYYDGRRSQFQETHHHNGGGGGGGGYYDEDRHPRRREDDARYRSRQPRYNRADRSGVVEWTAAVVFTILAIVVLLAAVTVLVVVLLLQPRAPYLAIGAASTLDTLVYDQSGALDDVQLSLRVEAHNDDGRSAASFSRLELRLAFGGAKLAILRADPFALPPKGTLPLAYVARAQGASLDATRSNAMEEAIREGVVPFGVEGEAKTKWKIAGIVGVHHWTRLACEIKFFWPNRTAVPFKCNSKSKFWFF